MSVFRMKRHTIKIIFLTSFLWLAMDILLLLLYTDCEGEECPQQSSGSLDHSRRGAEGPGPVAGRGLKAGSGAGVWGEYMSPQLHPWTKRGAVLPASHSLPGEKGRPVKTPQGREEEKKEKFKVNQFNLVVSEMISVNRSLKDVRLAECRNKQYPALLPRTSIVIVFHNEAWSTLLRTLHSIINRSPHELLEEILLVDDSSSHTHLGQQLELEVARLPVPVRVLRTGSRSGLIRARLLGASEAKGSILTFLDSHVEATEGWLEPLLTEVAKDRRRVVCPIIDVISDETFEYVSASDMTWGGFNWKLNFRWYKVPQRELDRRDGDRSLPLHTPTMAGGLFSIDRF